MHVSNNNVENGQDLLTKVLHRTSRTTLTKYMNALVGLGILSPQKDGKEVFYLNNDLIRILGV